MKPKIFISHTTKDLVGSKRLQRLTAGLNEAGFDVLIDRDHLTAGESWRHEIYSWIGLCQAAIVMVTPRALEPANPWVAREAAILMWRRALNPRFRVIPVLLDGVDASDLNTGLFRDLLLQEVQAVAATGDAWIAAVITQLGTPGQKEPESPMETLAKLLAAQLTSASDATVCEAADVLNCTLGPWEPGVDSRLRLALRMLHLGLRPALPALEVLANYGATEAQLRQIVNLIAPTWVDLCAARWLADVGRRPSPRPALLLNAGSDFAARMYIRRAGSRPPQTSWACVLLTTVFGEAGADDIEAEVRTVLQVHFRLAPNAFSPAADRLNALLNTHQAEQRPIFVVARYSPGLHAHLPALRHRLPAVTFLLLGPLSLHDTSDSECELSPVRPDIGDGAEALAQQNFDYACTVLNLKEASS